MTSNNRAMNDIGSSLVTKNKGSGIQHFTIQLDNQLPNQSITGGQSRTNVTSTIPQHKCSTGLCDEPPAEPTAITPLSSNLLLLWVGAMGCRPSAYRLPLSGLTISCVCFPCLKRPRPNHYYQKNDLTGGEE